jgi:DNA replication protein DnaC
VSSDDEIPPINLREWAVRAHAKAAGHPSAVEPDDAELDQLIASATSGVNERRWHSAIPQRFHRAQMDDFAGQPFYADVMEWSLHAYGRNLVLAGPTGVGKTRLACAACRQALYDGAEVRLFSIVKLLDLLRPGGPDGALDDLVDVDRLIIDDLGMEKPSDWTGERISALIDARWSEERPTVVTTNLHREPLAAHLGAFAFSRLIGDGAIRLRLSGDDRRQP